MAYVEIPKKDDNKIQKPKRKFFSWIPGVHKIRLLDESIKPVYVHWVNGAYVKCLGNTCPICQEDFRIMNEDSNYRKNKDFHPRTIRYYTNILDLTLVKKCPKCGAEIHKREDGTWPDMCGECGANISTVEPQKSMEVKILSKGVTLFSQFNKFEQIYEKPPTEFNIALIVEDSRNVSTTALPTETEKYEIEKDKLYNLPDDAVLELTADELRQLAAGVSVRDILTARGNKEKTSPKENPDVQQSLDALFGGK